MKEQKQKTAVLLVNLGSPEAPTTAAVKTYLAEFLSDRRVIDLPRWLWLPILHGIILRLRPPKTAAAYQSIWQLEGTPLVTTTAKQAQLLQQRFINEKSIGIYYAMRYGQPSIAKGLQQITAAGYEQVLVFPLYPQYSRTTTETVRDKVSALVEQHYQQLTVSYIEKYYDQPLYIQALARHIQQFEHTYGKPEKLIFSYHGVPQRYITKGDVYDQHCFSTTAAVAQLLGLSEQDYLTTFQSRFGFEKWLQPYTDLTLKTLAKQGVKTVHIVSPAFSADCLETLEELEKENREYFETADGEDKDNTGGRIYRYIPALNTAVEHLDVFEFVIRQRLGLS